MQMNYALRFILLALKNLNNGIFVWQRHSWPLKGRKVIRWFSSNHIFNQNAEWANFQWYGGPWKEVGQTWKTVFWKSEFSKFPSNFEISCGISLFVLFLWSFVRDKYANWNTPWKSCNNVPMSSCSFLRIIVCYLLNNIAVCLFCLVWWIESYRLFSILCNSPIFVLSPVYVHSSLWHL